MATTTPHNGTNLILKVDNRTVAYAISNDFDISKTAIDVSSKQDGSWTSRIMGRGDWSCSVEGRFVEDDTVTGLAQSLEELINLLTNGTKVAVIFGSTTSGDMTLEGSAYIENISISAPDNDSATFTANLVADGSLTVSVVS